MASTEKQYRLTFNQNLPSVGGPDDMERDAVPPAGDGWSPISITYGDGKIFILWVREVEAPPAE